MSPPKSQANPIRRYGPQVEALEPRLLFSAAMMGAPVIQDLPDVLAATSTILHAPLSEGVVNSGGGPEESPTFEGFDPVILGEDGNHHFVDLDDAFRNVGGTTTGLHFEIVQIDNGALFDAATIEGHQLKLDLARHAFGNADIVIRASNASGFVEATLPVAILPVNDRPTTTGMQDVALAPRERLLELDLFAHFDDIEDEDNQLSFEVTGNTNPELFESISIDPVQGIMTILVAPGVAGTSTLTIRATDSEGAYVEMTGRGGEFPVYEAILGDHAAISSLGLQNLNEVTSWWLFDYVDGQYIYDHINESQLRYYLHSEYYDPSLPTVFDIENSFFYNTPSGRELRAQVMRIFWEERPDAQLAGFYDYLPARAWHESVNWRRAQDDLVRGVNTWYSRNHQTFEQENTQWQANNALWRTAPLADGSVVSDYVTRVYPSLYTSYRFGYATYAGHEIKDVQFDGSTSQFSVNETLIVNGLEVAFNDSHHDDLPIGIRTYTSYFVVNSDGHTFQLAETRDGNPLMLDPGQTGAHLLEIVGPRDFGGYDPDVLYWKYYAEEMIAESRKFDVNVTAYISPSYRGVGVVHLDENFFRLQLDTLYELADSIALYNPHFLQSEDPDSQGWYRALSDFTDYLQHPTQFDLTVDTTDPDGGTLRGDNAPRTDRFHTIAFPAWQRMEAFQAGDPAHGRVAQVVIGSIRPFASNLAGQLSPHLTVDLPGAATGAMGSSHFWDSARADSANHAVVSRLISHTTAHQDLAESLHLDYSDGMGRVDALLQVSFHDDFTSRSFRPLTRSLWERGATLPDSWRKDEHFFLAGVQDIIKLP